MSPELTKVFKKSVIKITIDEEKLPKNIVDAKTTFETPDGKKVPNAVIKYIINGKPVKPTDGHNVHTKVTPTSSTVTVRVTVEVPKVGSKSKTVYIPVEKGKMVSPKRECFTITRPFLYTYISIPVFLISLHRAATI